MLTQHRDTDPAADYYTADGLMSSRRYEAAHTYTRRQTSKQCGKEARIPCQGRPNEAA